MGKVEEAKRFLADIRMPVQQQTNIAAYTLLTLSHIKPDDVWKNATNDRTRIHDVIRFTEEYYGRTYAENTRETIRKNCMHQFRLAALIEDNGKATNSPNYRYRITNQSLVLLKAIHGESSKGELLQDSEATTSPSSSCTGARKRWSACPSASTVKTCSSVPESIISYGSLLRKLY